MARKRQLNRKEFLALTVTSVGAGAWLLACGSGDDDDGTGGAGPSAGTGGTTGGTSGAGGKGGAGATGAGGTGTGATGAGGTGTGATGAGGTGTGATGAGGTGTGATGAGGTGAGGTGAGGTGAGGTGAGGTGAGGTGAGGGSGGGASANCIDLSFEQTNDWPHDHIPADMAARETFFDALMAHINGATPTMPFTLPMEGITPHTHTITFTAGEIAMLKGGGSVSKMKDTDDVDDMHTWSIGCG